MGVVCLRASVPLYRVSAHMPPRRSDPADAGSSHGSGLSQDDKNSRRERARNRATLIRYSPTLDMRQETSYRQWNIKAKNHLRAAELDQHCTDGPPQWGQICFANPSLDEKKKDDKIRKTRSLMRAWPRTKKTMPCCAKLWWQWYQQQLTFDLTACDA